MPSGRLHATTLKLVKNRPASMTYDAIALGSGLSLYWVKSFAEGKHDSLSTNVEKLWEYLTGTELQLDYPISPTHYR